jgi:hypothetical protein
VGRGSSDAGQFDLSYPNKNQPLTDRSIETALQADILSGKLKPPDANRLYIVYVEPGVTVQVKPGVDSVHSFLGYHSYFIGSDARGHTAPIVYAVIPYQGGANAHDPRFTPFDGSTQVTSHELAEAATDPMFTGWFQQTPASEIGDLAEGQVVRFLGYVVQKEADKSGKAMGPTGSTAIAGYTASHTSAGRAGLDFALFSTERDHEAWDKFVHNVSPMNR